MKDRFSDVHEFVTVAERGSFTVAAEQLGVTGSALSKSVSRLERRLGVKLFHRTTRRVALTPEGEAYLVGCQRALDELQNAESTVVHGGREPIGRVRLDLPAAFGRRFIMPTLFKLIEKHEKLDISVTFSERKIDLVNEGVDLAVRIGTLEDDAELVARGLGRQKLVICAAPSYLHRHGIPKSKEDLAEHDLVAGWRRGQRHRWLLKEEKGNHSLFDVSIRHDMGDGEAMLAATIAGCGLSQLPTWLISNELRSETLVTVLDHLSGGEMPIHAIWPRSAFIQPKLRVVIDELVLSAGLPNSGFLP